MDCLHSLTESRLITFCPPGVVGPEAVLVSVENFLYEVNDEIWIDLSCLVLSDPNRKINLQTFSQPTNVEAGYVEKLREGTGDNYPKQWSGFALTTGKLSQHSSFQQANLGKLHFCL